MTRSMDWVRRGYPEGFHEESGVVGQAVETELPLLDGEDDEAVLHDVVVEQAVASDVRDVHGEFFALGRLSLAAELADLRVPAG